MIKTILLMDKCQKDIKEMSQKELEHLYDMISHHIKNVDPVITLKTFMKYGSYTLHKNYFEETDIKEYNNALEMLNYIKHSLSIN